MIDLRQGDCLELLKDIPDKSIDLVIIDPPYEFNTGVGGGAFGDKKRDYHKEYISLYKETGSTKDTERLRIIANTMNNVQHNRHLSKGFNLKVLDELERIMKATNIYVWCSKAQIGKLITYYESKNIKRHLGVALYNHTRNFYDYDMQVDCNITYNQLKLLGEYINQLEEENKELQENYKAILKQRDDITKNATETIEKYQQENKQLQQKVNQLEGTLNEVKEWKEEFGDACTFSIVSNPSLGGWYSSLEDILDKAGSSNE